MADARNPHDSYSASDPRPPSDVTIEFIGRLTVPPGEAPRTERHLQTLMFQIGATVIGVERSDNPVPLLPSDAFITPSERALHHRLQTPLTQALPPPDIPRARVEALTDNGVYDLRAALVLGAKYAAAVRSVGEGTMEPLRLAIAAARGMESNPRAAWPNTPGFADRAQWCSRFDQISGGVIDQALCRYNLLQLLAMPPRERLVVLSAVGTDPSAHRLIPPNPQVAESTYAAIQAFARAFAEARWAWVQGSGEQPPETS
jgi:hypothetical protein